MLMRTMVGCVLFGLFAVPVAAQDVMADTEAITKELKTLTAQFSTAVKALQETQKKVETLEARMARQPRDTKYEARESKKQLQDVCGARGLKFDRLSVQSRDGAIEIHCK